MNKTDKKAAKRGKRSRVLLIILILAVSAAAVFIALKKNPLKTKGASSKQITFDVNAGNIYAWTDDGLLIASGTGMQLISENGDTLVAGSAVLQNPAMAHGTNMAAVWSVGSKDFYTVSKAKGAQKTSTGREVINASVNNENWVAVSALEDGYNGAVNIYNNKMKPVYKWSSGDGYLVDAAVADSCDKMAAITINDSGSKVQFFSLNSTDQKGSYTLENTVLFDLAYVGASSVCALSDSSAIFLNDKGNLISKYDFSDGYLRDYSFDGSGFAALVIGKYKAGNSGTIVTLSPTGAALGKLDINSEILSVSARGKYLAVLYTDTMVIYRSDLTVYAKVDDTASVRQVLMRPDGSVVLLSNSGAAVYKPK